MLQSRPPCEDSLADAAEAQDEVDQCREQEASTATVVQCHLKQSMSQSTILIRKFVHVYVHAMYMYVHSYLYVYVYMYVYVYVYTLGVYVYFYMQQIYIYIHLCM